MRTTTSKNPNQTQQQQQLQNLLMCARRKKIAVKLNEKSSSYKEVVYRNSQTLKKNSLNG
jgi:hypothetical protein